MKNDGSCAIIFHIARLVCNKYPTKSLTQFCRGSVTAPKKRYRITGHITRLTKKLQFLCICGQYNMLFNEKRYLLR